jgi:hypothetical protein
MKKFFPVVRKTFSPTGNLCLGPPLHVNLLFIVVQAALKAVSSKVTKYKKVYFDSQHAFISFAHLTFLAS